MTTLADPSAATTGDRRAVIYRMVTPQHICPSGLKALDLLRRYCHAQSYAPGAPPLSADWYRGDGPMARTVADTAYATNIIVGPHAGDHATIAPAHVLPTAFAGAAGVAGGGPIRVSAVTAPVAAAAAASWNELAASRAASAAVGAAPLERLMRPPPPGCGR